MIRFFLFFCQKLIRELLMSLRTDCQLATSTARYVQAKYWLVKVKCLFAGKEVHAPVESDILVMKWNVK